MRFRCRQEDGVLRMGLVPLEEDETRPFSPLQQDSGRRQLSASEEEGPP